MYSNIIHLNSKQPKSLEKCITAMMVLEREVVLLLSCLVNNVPTTGSAHRTNHARG